MLFMYDVWVSWCEGALNRHDVPEFHEWRKYDDTCELVDQIPLLYVTNELYDYIADEERDLPKKLLEAIHNRTRYKKGMERVTVRFAAVVTNGQEKMVFCTEDGSNAPVKKSKLIIRHDRMVSEMIEPFEPEGFDFTPPPKEEEDLLVNGIPITKDDFIGLTRSERNMKKLVMAILEDLYLNERKDEIVYWFVEWDPSVYNTLIDWTFDEAWEKLVEELKTGWSDKHTEFVRQISSGTEYHKKKFQECFISEEKKNVQ